MEDKKREIASSQHTQRRTRGIAAGEDVLWLVASLPLEVRFHFEFFSQFVFTKVFNRDSGCCFKDYLGLFFLISIHGHISSHKAYAFLEHKRRDQSAPQSGLTRKGVRLSGVAFYFLRLKTFWPHLALRRASRCAQETPLKTLIDVTCAKKMKKWRIIFSFIARKHTICGSWFLLCSMGDALLNQGISIKLAWFFCSKKRKKVWKVALPCVF